jgi:hypothetical protein
MAVELDSRLPLAVARSAPGPLSTAGVLSHRAPLIRKRLAMAMVVGMNRVGQPSPRRRDGTVSATAVPSQRALEALLATPGLLLSLKGHLRICVESWSPVVGTAALATVALLPCCDQGLSR